MDATTLAQCRLNGHFVFLSGSGRTQKRATKMHFQVQRKCMYLRDVGRFCDRSNARGDICSVRSLSNALGTRISNVRKGGRVCGNRRSRCVTFVWLRNISGSSVWFSEKTDIYREPSRTFIIIEILLQIPSIIKKPSSLRHNFRTQRIRHTDFQYLKYCQLSEHRTIIKFSLRDNKSTCCADPWQFYCSFSTV